MLGPLFGLGLVHYRWHSFNQVYDERDDFDFEKVNNPFLDRDVPRSTSCGVCVLRLALFFFFFGGGAGQGGCSRGRCFSSRNKFLNSTTRISMLHGAFSGFCCRRSGLVVGCSICLRTLLQRGISEPMFCGNLVYKFGGIVGRPSFGHWFGRII